MILVRLLPNDCPDMPMFRFLWYWSFWLDGVYSLIRANFRNMRFGNIGEVFKRIPRIIFRYHEMLNFDYYRVFKGKFDVYDKFIRGV